MRARQWGRRSQDPYEQSVAAAIRRPWRERRGPWRRSGRRHTGRHTEWCVRRRSEQRTRRHSWRPRDARGNERGRTERLLRRRRQRRQRRVGWRRHWWVWASLRQDRRRWNGVGWKWHWWILASLNRDSRRRLRWHGFGRIYDSWNVLIHCRLGGKRIIWSWVARKPERPARTTC